MRCLSLTKLDQVKVDVDLVELRLDLANSGVQEVAEWMEKQSLPILLTCGTLDPQKWAELDPDWIDVPVGTAAPRLNGTRLIRSYHNYEGMEVDLPAILREPADLHKIALTPVTGVDTLDLLEMSRPGLLVVGMGENGMPARQMSHLTHNPWTYVHQGKATAAGQLHAEFIRPGTVLLGLLGDPISMSPSHLTHNRRLKMIGSDAIYCKWRVPPSELATFVERIQSYPVRGFSVTTPLKQAIVPHLHESTSPIVNTIVVENGRWTGHNTDGAGALNAIEKRERVKGAKMLIIGAGATAQAIATEAKKRGAHVRIANRSLREIEFPRIPFSKVAEEPYDILVQATPVGMGDAEAMVVPKEAIRPGTVALDVVHAPPETALVRAARARGCRVVTGLEFFHEQAALQFELWGIMGYAQSEQLERATPL